MKTIKVNDRQRFHMKYNDFTGIMKVYEDDEYRYLLKITTYKNGKPHSFNDEPAVNYVSTDHKMWYKNGKKHRGNGKPAIVPSKKYTIGDVKPRYWINGEQVSKEAAKVYALLFQDTQL